MRIIVIEPLNSYPADFECTITPRSEKAMELLKLSVVEA
jgi:hypothetical protein